MKTHILMGFKTTTRKQEKQFLEFLKNIPLPIHLLLISEKRGKNKIGFCDPLDS